MQRVTNCVFTQDDSVLMLQKPRRNWWVAPGGKMEQGEHIAQAVFREFSEETGLRIEGHTLSSVLTYIIKDKDNHIVNEWMMFTFKASNATGTVLETTEEGILSWQPIEAIKTLPMAEGDRKLIDHALHGTGILSGTLEYTEDFRLLHAEYFHTEV
ncbi:NUDIX hydrolase [Mangrovibacillus cuniculi]|uniref:8-oxo-dGTP diphosphatase n=1 Tax=Mangrovibacillus cuniculi TaxID=2593652 RepID=A0A7S8CCS1_9BACI|nr:8-oxo-dGTP diphosphatase [Mangrovibacillus cuniculi]QPC47456.1 8-oxo-dGTP diphosphatase [Mangrovibacillus cuniculi]